MSVSFFVDGVPQPQGSKRHVGNGRMIESAKGLKAWRREVTDAAVLAMADRHWLDGALFLSAVFYLPRPKGHYRAGRYAGQLRDSAPVWHVVKPDVDKLVRALGDAMTGIVYQDDSRIAGCLPLKVYGDRPGVRITVTQLEGTE